MAFALLPFCHLCIILLCSCHFPSSFSLFFFFSNFVISIFLFGWCCCLFVVVLFFGLGSLLCMRSVVSQLFEVAVRIFDHWWCFLGGVWGKAKSDVCVAKCSKQGMLCLFCQETSQGQASSLRKVTFTSNLFLPQGSWRSAELRDLHEVFWLN